MSLEDDDEEIPKDCISPNADVFSYFQLAAPGQRKIHGRFTVDACMSYVLVFVVLFIQCVLLYCVSNKVITKNINWQSSVMNTGEHWNLAAVASTNASACRDGQSLCTLEKGIFTCAPPSVQLIGRWDELDLDNDGVWTRAEVEKSRDEIKCKYVVDPIEVFDVMTLLLKERKKYVWLHPDVETGKAIPKAYFTYIMGDIAMCGYRNGDMCGNLVNRGFFDAAIMHDTAPRVGNTVRSALEYCHGLLDEGGFCERVLPSTYSTWKIESVQECGGAEFDPFVHKDPKSGSVKSLLKVDYKARIRYETAKTLIFKVYKACILFLWVLLIVHHLREVNKMLSWLSQLKTASSEEQLEHATKSAQASAMMRQRSELRGDEIKIIHLSHRIVLWIVTLLRISILVVLGYVGLNFLARQTDYIGLLLDGVALIFIVEVEQIIYERVLRQEVRTSWEEREPIELKKVGLSFLLGRPDITDMLWLCGIAIFAVCFLLYYTSSVVEPLYQALECACLSEGEMCREAHTFSYAFWEQYWMKDVPSSIEAINQLNGGLPLNDVKPSLVAAPTPGTSPARAPVAAAAAVALVTTLLPHGERAGRAAVNLLHRSLSP